MKYALKGDEHALIEIFSKFFTEDFNAMNYNDQMFKSDCFKQNIFHAIAYFSMTKFLPILIDFLYTTIYSN